MKIEEAVFSALSSDAGLTAIVPATRIKPEGPAQNIPYPFIKHFLVAMRVDQMHSGMVPLKVWIYQIAYYATSPQQIGAIREALLLMANASRHPYFSLLTTSREPGINSMDLGVYGESMDFEVWFDNAA